MLCTHTGTLHVLDLQCSTQPLICHVGPSSVHRPEVAAVGGCNGCGLRLCATLPCMQACKQAMTKEIEALLGPTVLTKAGAPTVPIASAIGSADIVLLYFSASWCPPCRSFTPLLKAFVEENGKKSGIQVVFVSSDSDLRSFEEYFKKMPWLSLPADAETTKIKQKLEQMFQIRGIPALIAIDAKNGKYITDDARSDVVGAGGDDAKQKEIIQKWKSIEAVPIEEATSAVPLDPQELVPSLYFFSAIPSSYLAFSTLHDELWPTCKKWGKTVRTRVVLLSFKIDVSSRGIIENSNGTGNIYSAMCMHVDSALV